MITIDGIIYKLQEFGGISVYFNELFKALHKNEVPFEIILYENKKLNDIQNSIIRRPRILERYRDCFVSNNVDIFHSTYYRVPSANYRKLNVVTVHDFLYEKYARLDKRIIHSHQKNNAIQKADAIICVSNRTKEDLFNFCKISSYQKVFVIHNGVTEIFKPSNKVLKNEKPYLLYVGNRSGYKNFSLIRDSLEKLQDFDLFIVGGEPLSQEEKSLNSKYKNINIKWFNRINQNDLVSLYQNAYCLIYPSLDEGFGIPIIEAMKCGCPVICLKKPIFEEVAGNAGIFIENFKDSLVEEILNLSKYQMDQRAKVIEFSSKFSWENTHKQTTNVYEYLKQKKL